jgi:chromosome segregation ATPase
MRVFPKQRTSHSGGRRGIFRKKKATVPSIQPAVTMNLSEEEGDEEPVTVESPKVQKISTYIFTEEELRTNELNHQRQLAAKQEEIVKMQTVHKELKKELALKEQQLTEVKEKLSHTEEELASAEQEKSQLKAELTDTYKIVAETKETLNTVGSALIQCQHELHEQKGLFHWPFWWNNNNNSSDESPKVESAHAKADGKTIEI